MEKKKKKRDENFCDLARISDFTRFSRITRTLMISIKEKKIKPTLSLSLNNF